MTSDDVCDVLGCDLIIQGELNNRSQLLGFSESLFGYSFMLRSQNQTTNQIPRSYKNDAFDWPFDLVIVT